MRVFQITEAQLDELAGLNPEWPDEVKRQEELVAQIKTQIVVPSQLRQRSQPTVINPFGP